LSPAEFSVSTKVISGLGSLARLTGEVEQSGARRLAVVADRGVADAGLLAEVLQGVDSSAIAVTLLVDPDPDVAAAEHAAAAARAAECDLVLAVGGGSALAVGKATAIRLANDGRIDTYQGVNQVPAPPAPTIAIPTTAGSGSEVSKVLVLHEPGRKDELVVRADGCEPRVAILDGTVLRRLPRDPLLYAGLDALSHAMEAQWARHGSWFTAALGEAAAREIIEALPEVAEGARNGANRSGDNDEFLQRLIDASCAANMACGNSGLTLVHALSTAPSVHLPHGLKNGILLPYVASFNEEVSAPVTRSLIAQIGPLYRTLGFRPVFPSGLAETDAADAMVAGTTSGNPATPSSSGCWRRPACRGGDRGPAAAPRARALSRQDHADLPPRRRPPGSRRTETGDTALVGRCPRPVPPGSAGYQSPRCAFRSPAEVALPLPSAPGRPSP
jgi:alcohol dehydrogenase class IV